METGYVLEREGRYLAHIGGGRTFWSKALVDAKIFDTIRQAASEAEYSGSDTYIKKIEIKIIEDGDTSSK